MLHPIFHAMISRRDENRSTLLYGERAGEKNSHERVIMIGSLGLQELIMLGIFSPMIYSMAKFLIYLARGIPNENSESRGQILVAKSKSDNSNSSTVTPNELVLYCSKCEQGQPEGSKFCRACGEVIT